MNGNKEGRLILHLLIRDVSDFFGESHNSFQMLVKYFLNAFVLFKCNGCNMIYF